MGEFGFGGAQPPRTPQLDCSDLTDRELPDAGGHGLLGGPARDETATREASGQAGGGRRGMGYFNVLDDIRRWNNSAPIHIETSDNKDRGA